MCEPRATAEGMAPRLGASLRTAENLRAVAALLNSDPAETLVVLGPHVPSHDALDFTSELRMARPGVGVILARDEVDSNLLTLALQAGVREVVAAGDNAALTAACHRSLRVSQRIIGTSGDAGAAPTGQVITVFAPKGGVGKTTLAINLGCVLAEQGDGRVCVIDLDLAFGQVAISVGLDPQRTIVDALAMAGRVDTFGTDMLLAPINPGDADKVPASLVSELLRVLRGMFSYVVIDTPPALSEHVLTAMDASDHHVFITTPEVPTLKNLRVALDTMDLLSYPQEKRSVVLNRSDSKIGLSLDHVERVLRTSIAAHIPSSRAVPMSINKAIPITVESPKHPVSRAIARFAQTRLVPARAARDRGQHVAVPAISGGPR
jgi:pilus assembly protein CpaE